MSGGGNGLKPHEVIAKRDKCPDSPTKHRYNTADEAWAAARERSQATGLDIVSYLCGGCGYSHLTKRKHGEDVYAAAQVGVTSVAARTKLRAVPKVIPARIPITVEVEEGPIVPGNKDARRKVIAQFLSENPQPRTADIQSVVAVTTQTLRTDLMEMGYLPVQDGKGKRWVPKGQTLQAIASPETDEPETDEPEAQLRDKLAKKKPATRKRKATSVQVARRKVIAKYLKDHPTPKTKEIAELVGIGSNAARDDMIALGYHSVGKTLAAHWVINDDLHIARQKHALEKQAVEEPPVVVARLEDEQEVSRAMERHPANGGVRPPVATETWIDVDVDALGDMPLTQVLTVLRATGMQIRFQLHP